MNCPKCGATNAKSAVYCLKCGQKLGEGGITFQPMIQQENTQKMTNPHLIPTYLVQSILVTLFCCLPFGIPAIVFAAQVSTKISLGDSAGALEASKKAKTWCWVSFISGLVILVIYIAALFLGLGFMKELHDYLIKSQMNV